MTDTQPDIIQTDGEDSQKEENFSKISILDLQKKYEIGRDPLYARMRYLQIKTWKVSGKAYLYADQIAQMDALHDHIKTTGRMEGYPVPEPSGPVEEEQPTSSTLAVAETQQLSTTSNYAPKQKRSQSSPQDDVAAIVNSAQNKAAGTLIAENVLAQHFIQNPELLPDELKTKIKESAQMPGIDPFAYADSLINIAMGSITAA
ncbi:hypothetical protein ANSO36C_67580 (plasmid) [Nostoc cf. commune SO-36]|uniref:Terminase small subunit n=1 Tax=Nostoc cf. commune SO-36 TaxID=449208 RepID=A0ABN6QCT4_NOSCO|nr:hypothetical protein [Nostoc commune]BDI20956.1 hypothetical protein ANSO36C_67580 [Nostoc cf. commune SO-36]